jgi:hypothetical protein
MLFERGSKAQLCRNCRRCAVLSIVRSDMAEGLIYSVLAVAGTQQPFDSISRSRLVLDGIKAIGVWPLEPEVERWTFLALPELASNWSLAAVPD